MGGKGGSERVRPSRGESVGSELGFMKRAATCNREILEKESFELWALRELLNFLL